MSRFDNSKRKAGCLMNKPFVFFFFFYVYTSGYFEYRNRTERAEQSRDTPRNDDKPKHVRNGSPRVCIYTHTL